jgi:hypothetical protein
LTTLPPFISIEPESGLVIPVSKFIRVLFPQPLLPRIPKNSCLLIEKLTFERVKLEYFLDTFLNSISYYLDLRIGPDPLDFFQFYRPRTIRIIASILT